MRIYISGIGGTGAYYIAKYFLSKGDLVFGSDLNAGERVTGLQKLGAKVNVGEPNTESVPEVDMYVYSPALPENHPERQFFKDKHVVTWDVGEITMKIINDFLEEKMSPTEVAAVQESELVPLAQINWSDKQYIAVTGTDGKTTTVSMIYDLLRQQGKSVAALTTIGFRVNDQIIETGLHTTSPTSQDLLKLLQMPELSAIDYVVLEVTSHALSMGRVAGARFDTAVITNITSEHLDYHQTRENYFNAKASLLTKHLKPSGRVILNDIDSSFPELKRICEQNNIKFEVAGDYVGELVLPKFMDTDYNQTNARLAGLATESERVDLSGFTGVKGRMEIIQSTPFEVIVDFAHTENALRKVLEYLRKKVDGSGQNGKLRVVFGCAGMRDKQKRPGMGKVAVELADVIYLCPEDPRIEELSSINKTILSGMDINLPEDFAKQEHIKLTTKHNKLVEVFQSGNLSDRREAIATAIAHAELHDIVVVCGKGHELSMCFGTEEQEWSDQSEIQKILGTLENHNSQTADQNS